MQIVMSLFLVPQKIIKEHEKGEMVLLTIKTRQSLQYQYIQLEMSVIQVIGTGNIKQFY